jgi:hypothetical protein
MKLTGRKAKNVSKVENRKLTAARNLNRTEYPDKYKTQICLDSYVSLDY